MRYGLSPLQPTRCATRGQWEEASNEEKDRTSSQREVPLHRKSMAVLLLVHKQFHGLLSEKSLGQRRCLHRWKVRRHAVKAAIWLPLRVPRARRDDSVSAAPSFRSSPFTDSSSPQKGQRRLECRRGEAPPKAQASSRHCVPVALPTTCANAPVVVA